MSNTTTKVEVELLFEYQGVPCYLKSPLRSCSPHGGVIIKVLKLMLGQKKKKRVEDLPLRLRFIFSDSELFLSGKGLDLFVHALDVHVRKLTVEGNPIFITKDPHDTHHGLSCASGGDVMG